MQRMWGRSMIWITSAACTGQQHGMSLTAGPVIIPDTSVTPRRLAARPRNDRTARAVAQPPPPGDLNCRACRV